MMIPSEPISLRAQMGAALAALIALRELIPHLHTLRYLSDHDPEFTPVLQAVEQLAKDATP